MSVPNRCLLPVIAVAVLVCASGRALAQLNDQIVGSSGAPIRGRITVMTPTEVTIQSSGSADRKIPVNEIQRLTFAEDPGELRRARDLVRDGQLESAKAELAKIDVSQISRNVIQQDILFYQAFCDAKLALAGTGDKRAAGQLLLNFIKSNPGSYHYLDALQVFGDLAMAAGSFQAAADYYNQLGGQAPWPEVKMRAAVLEASALRAERKFPEAMQRYERVVEMEIDTADAAREKLFAQIGKAYCLAETEKQQEGIEILEQIIRENDPHQHPVMFGQAYNALGACYRQAGQPKEALMAYLHVDILFRRDPETHAEALYFLSQLWNDVNKSDRAVRARSLLRESYAGSVWAKQN